ncbi:hypothetical protein [Sphaerotilus sp.]|uniref:hypothetical protein n=1 Tax=Sphaerotilus sp. TaxID=2093942 RepID=UPI0034E1B883
MKLAHARKEFTGLYEGMLADEQQHQHYSRALGWLVAVLLTAIAVLGMVAAAGHPAANPVCRTAGDGLPDRIAPLSLELARTPGEVSTLLRGRSAMQQGVPVSLDEAVCIEARIARHRDLLGLDSALFIPLYVLLALAALGWILAASVPPEEGDPPDRDRHRSLPRYLLWLALVSVVCVGVTATLDAAENRAAWQVLDVASGQGALDPATLNDWQTRVTDARAASLRKWLACAAWATTLALLAGSQRQALARPEQPPQHAGLRRVLVAGLIALGVFAATAVLLGAILGMGLSGAHVDMWVRGLLRAGLAAMFGYATVICSLHLLRPVPRCAAETGQRSPPQRPDPG